MLLDLEKRVKDRDLYLLTTLTTLGKKLQILRNKNVLNNTPYYLKEDFSRKKIRKELQGELYNEGKKAVGT